MKVGGRHQTETGTRLSSTQTTDRTFPHRRCNPRQRCLPQRHQPWGCEYSGLRTVPLGPRLGVTLNSALMIATLWIGWLVWAIACSSRDWTDASETAARALSLMSTPSGPWGSLGCSSSGSFGRVDHVACRPPTCGTGDRLVADAFLPPRQSNHLGSRFWEPRRLQPVAVSKTLEHRMLAEPDSRPLRIGGATPTTV